MSMMFHRALLRINEKEDREAKAPKEVEVSPEPVTEETEAKQAPKRRGRPSRKE